jgi:hypothetical protein
MLRAVISPWYAMAEMATNKGGEPTDEQKRREADMRRLAEQNPTPRPKPGSTEKRNG